MTWKTTLSFLVTCLKRLVNTLDNKKKFRFPIVVFLALMGFINLENAQAQNVNVTIPSGGFEIDANLVSNSPSSLANPTSPAGDWVEGVTGPGGHVLNSDGTPINPATTEFFRDDFNSASDNTFSQGKAGDDPKDWKWTSSSANPSKGDIHNAMYHIGKDALNNQWIFIASDRLTTNGTSYIDFEFFQNTLNTNSSGGFISAGPDGGRTVDDILLTMEYGNGGSVANVFFYLWKSTGDTSFGWVLQTTSGINAFAQTNTETIDVPFGAFGKSTYNPLQFVEGAINLTSVFGQTGDPCFGVNIKTLLVKTKNSNAPTASLNDFIGPLPVSLSFGNAAIIYANPVCSNSAPVKVVQTGVSNGTYSASPSGLNIDSSSGEIDVIGSDAGTYTVTYSFTTNGCTKTATTDFTILALPNTPIAIDSEQPGCDLTTGTISVENVVTNWTYTITGSNNFTDSNQTGNFIGLAPGDYFIKVTNLDGCTSDPSPVIKIIEFNDNEKPSISCPADVVANTDTGECTASGVVLGTPTGTDNCDTELSFTNDAPDVFPVGDTMVTWTATDDAGNEQTCQQKVTVKDSEKPSIICATNQNQSTDTGLNTAYVSVTPPATNDNCGVASVVNDFNGTADASGTYPLGITKIIWTVTDIHGNTNTCEQDITITDKEDPVINCSADQTQTADADACNASVSVNIPSATDNNLVASVINDYNGTADASGIYPVGTTTITWTVTDNDGNSSSCTQDIIVTDNQDPSITCAADQTQPADAGLCTAAVIVNAPATSDNCEVASIVNDFNGTANASGIYPVGTTVVTWTVTDIHDNTNTCVQNITVIDNQPPVITAGDNIDTTADNELCSAALTIVPATAGDNCSVGNPTGTRDDGEALTAPYPTGITTITWTVTDINGNQALAVEQTVTVSDNEKPNISCPANVVANTDTGECTASGVVLGTPTGTDNCDTELSFTNDAPDVFPVGDTMVTWTATDDAGNEQTCQQKVTVKDSEKPSIICATNQNQSTDTGLNTAYVSVTPPATNDNCGVASVVNDFNGTADASGTYPLGITKIIWTVTDIHGNTNTCEQDITITDKEDPVINCSADQTQTADADACNASVSVNIPSATDNNLVASVINDYNGTADASGIYPVGTTTITWTVTDNDGNSSSCTQDIIVTDNQDPSITCAADQTQPADAGLCTAAVIVNAPATSDNCEVASIVNDFNGTANASGIYPVGTTVVTWTVTDIHDNTKTCVQNITVIDNQPPVFDSVLDITVNVDAGICGATVNYEVPTATDNCEGTVVTLTEGLASGSEFPVGTTTVTYTATDAAGNTVSTSFTVTVLDNEAPVIVCNENISQAADSGSATAVVTFEAPVGTDNCEATTEQTAGLPSGSKFPIGTTTNTYVVTDSAGNTATCSFTVTITDEEDPTISCPANINMNVDAGLCGAVVEFEMPEANDNSGNVTVAQTAGPASGELFPVGTTTVSFTATDEAGNTATCSFTVTVEDNEAPVFDAVSNITLNVDAGICGASVNYEIPTATDNCEGTEVTLAEGLAPGSEFPVGTTTVTYTVTDAAGNTVSTSFTVTVRDNEAPVIACPENISLTVEYGVTSLVVNYQSVAVTDNCPDTTIEQTAGLASGSSFPVGTTTNTFVVTDASGNTATCSFEIKVVELPEEKPQPPVVVEVIQPTCEVPTGTITVQTEEGLTYSINGTDYQESEVFIDLEPGTYSVTAQNGSGEISDVVQITLAEPAAETIQTTTKDLCIEDDPFDLFELLIGDNDESGTWEDTDQTGALTGSVINPELMAVGTYTFNYVLGGSCPSTTSVQVSINDLCVVLPCNFDDIKNGISKVVTPGRDTFNDFFIVDQERDCGFSYNLKIFNRWGNEVFRANNYQNNWDGQSNNSFASSNRLSSGTYYYIIEIIGSGFKPIQGYIYLGTK
ncbi:HYR domain-containing protein [Gillisia sp. Q332]|uniref:HYR domain-containing protein n=1 Tax=Gillisia xinjiangensis TaxID=3384765 RepID=UPI00391C1AAE